MSFLYREADGIGFYEVEGWQGARGVFSTRIGGVSEGPYAGLNLGFGADERGHIVKNRALLARAIGIDASAIRTIRQVHGNDVYVLGSPGPAEFDGGVPDGGFDASVTDVRGAALGVLTADCVPILMYDPEAGAVAAVHAGWAGTLSGVAGKAVSKMVERYGSDASGIHAAIGPSIGPCCYEVDEKVTGRMEGPPRDAEGILHPARPGHWILDLWEANRRVLIRSGLSPDNIAVMGLCTSCNPDKFFSHRKSGGNAGRMMAIVLLE